MKIAYVSYNLMDTIINGGVGRKIKAAVESWNSFGHQAHWFATSSECFSDDRATTMQFAGSNVLTRELQKSITLSRLLNVVAAFKPDLIYLRAGIYTYPLERLFKMAPVVIELNTLDLVEYKKRGRLRYNFHKATRDIVFNKAEGFVAVSSEIASDLANIKYAKPTLVSGNGINLNRHTVLPVPDNLAPRLVFIGTPNNRWHGLDKITRLADRIPDFIFDVVGTSYKDIINWQVPANINLHGFLGYNDYASVLAKADLGIGSLALHRSAMMEASPLKVREYLAHGLPVIIGYQDTDLSGKNLDFVLEIPNEEANVENCFHQIYDFALKMKGRRVDRELIEPLIDGKVKDELKLSFFQSIVEGSAKEKYLIQGKML